MAREMATSDLPTAYERAVCYYTLPKVTHPVTYGIIAAYAVCLFEAIAALIVGVTMDSRPWTVAGTFALVGIIVLGIAVFTARALMNDVRQRKALATAAKVTAEPEAPDDDIPDPFADHMLLRRALAQPATIYECGAQETPLYRVEPGAKRRSWRVVAPDGGEVCRAQAHGGAQSFLFDAWTPGRVNVHVGDELVAHLEGRFSFTRPRVDISVLFPEERHFTARQQGIYYGHCLIGRIYTLRHSVYLDVNRFFFNEALLAYFVMSL